MRLLRVLQCRLFGHPDTRCAWGPWQNDLGLGRYRVLTDECVRCGAVLDIRSRMEGELW